MSTKRAISLNQIRESLKENANRSFKVMLQQLEQSPQNISFLTPDVLISAAATASGMTQQTVGECMSRFHRNYGGSEIKQSDTALVLGALIRSMPSEMREKTMGSMPEGLLKQVQDAQRNLQKQEQSALSP